ncbi:MAG: thiol peroxidase [Oligoflexales bacterium]
MMKFVQAISIAFILGSCATTAKYEPTKESVAPGTSVTWRGEPAALSTEGKLAIGEAFPSVRVVDGKLEPKDLYSQGQVTVISIVPSIDTPLCDAQTHQLGENRTLSDNVRKITVSMDLPFAQKRFATEASLTNIEYFSDYQLGDFGNKTGLRVMRNNLLTRAVVVVDQAGIVRHIQVVPDVSKMPDMQAAFDIANNL